MMKDSCTDNDASFIMERPTGDEFQWHGTNDGKAGGSVSSVSVCEGERLPRYYGENPIGALSTIFYHGAAAVLLSTSKCYEDALV